MSVLGEGLLAPLAQLWSPGRAYRALLDRRSAVPAALSAGGIVLAVSSALMLIVAGSAGWTLATPGGASIPAVSLPLFALGERLLVAAAAGTAAWGVARASGRRSSLGLQLQAAWLAQPVLIIAAGISLVVLDVAGAPAGASPGPGMLLGRPSAGSPALLVMAGLLLDMLDIPSILCLICWGLGMAALEERTPLSGIATAFAIYVLAILILAFPALSSLSG